MKKTQHFPALLTEPCSVVGLSFEQEGSSRPGLLLSTSNRNYNSEHATGPKHHNAILTALSKRLDNNSSINYTSNKQMYKEQIFCFCKFMCIESSRLWREIGESL